MDLRWTVHPLRARPGRGLLALAIVAVSAAFAVAVGGHLVWGVAAAVFLVATVATYLFPTRYRLGTETVEVTILGARRRRSWTDLWLVAEDAEGILLSPSPRRGLFDPARTLFVRYAGNADEVRTFVRERLAR